MRLGSYKNRLPNLQPTFRKAIIIFVATLVAFKVTPFFLQRSIMIENTQFAKAEDLFASQNQPVAEGRRLSIPRLGIDTQIETVGLTKEGKMGLPSKPETVAWFNAGPKIGDAGNAVIAGHLDQQNGRPAVFAKLHDLEIGDTIEVLEDSDQKTQFKVVAKKSFAVDDTKALLEVFGPSETENLNLITCWGAWDTDKDRYGERLVVFTKKVL
jgi:LPXTG-site transpeptidase (sortase) family protein